MPTHNRATIVQRDTRRKRGRRGKEREKGREREKERYTKKRDRSTERSHRHHKRKRRRHESLESHGQEVVYSKRSRRTKHREESPTEELASVDHSATPSEMEYKVSHRHKHRRKRSHRHREEEYDVELRREDEVEGEEEDRRENEMHFEKERLAGEVVVEDRGVESVEASGSEDDGGETVEEDGGETVEAKELADKDVASEQKSEDDHQMEGERPVVRKHAAGLTEKSWGKTEEEGEKKVTVKKVSLVPYQDSSATEVEQTGDVPSAESGTETANIQSSSGANLNSSPAAVTGRTGGSPSEDGMDEIILHTEETIEGDGADMDVQCPSQDGKGKGRGGGGGDRLIKIDELSRISFTLRLLTFKLPVRL